jgi:hypothetical protein
VGGGGNEHINKNGRIALVGILRLVFGRGVLEGGLAVLALQWGCCVERNGGRSSGGGGGEDGENFV